MRCGSIYLVVKDFNKSLDFYEKLLDMEVSAINGERFAVFNNDGLNICLFNGYYDAEHPEQMKTIGESYPIYDDSLAIVNSENNRKIFINLGVHDLRKEYDRIVSLGIADELTPIRYLNVFSPYWYFTFMDPDGNPIEITGEYQEEN